MSVLVYDLTHLGRTDKELFKTLELIRRRGFSLQIAENKINTSGPGGEFIWKTIRAMIDFRSRAASTNIRNGQAYARYQGRKPGRPPLPLSVFNEIHLLKERGFSYAEIARRLKIDPSTVRRNILNHKKKQGQSYFILKND